MPRPTPRCLLPSLVLLAALGVVPTAATSQDDLDRTTADSHMAPLVQRYGTDLRSLDSFYDIDLSEKRLARIQAHDEGWTDRLAEVDFGDLDVAERIDHVLLRHHIEHAARRRATLRERLEQEHELLAFAPVIIGLEEDRWTLVPVDPEAAAATLDALAEQVEAITERVEAGQEADADEDDGAADEEANGDAHGSDGAKHEDPHDDAAAHDGARDGGDHPHGDEEHNAHDDDTDEEVEPLAVTPVVAYRVAQRVGQLERALDDWAHHYEAYVPAFGWWTEKPLQRTRDALDDYAELLREDVAGQEGEDDDVLLGDPIGRDALLDDLAAELIPYTPEQLITIGEEQLAWCTEQMIAASRELGYGDDWKAALEHVKGLHVPPGEQDALVMGQAVEAIAFLDENDLVTIPELCRETWRLRMLSRESQQTLPFAAYGGQVMLVAYPTADMDHDSKSQAMRGNNIHFSRLVTPHELIPGHHLQGFMAQRHGTHRRMFSTPFLGEGWALYWEMLEWDLGWPQGPEDRIGMLFWRMHRAARILVSLGFHLERMTPDEMIDFLVDRVGHERDNATAEVRRYIGPNYGPLYQCAYMIGGLQLYALHEELVGGGIMTNREFHDAILRQNSIPIEMIRAALRGDLLDRDHTASWMFAGEVEASEG